MTQRAMVFPVVTRGIIGPVSNAEGVDSIDSKAAINDGHGIPAHLGGAGSVMIVGNLHTCGSCARKGQPGNQRMSEDRQVRQSMYGKT
jgi:hypothetical protein